jgi:hypothetical protein
MRIAFLGNFNVPFTSESHYAATLEKMGHKVIRLQEPMVTTDRVYQVAIECDIFFWVHTHGWDLKGNRTMTEVLRRLERKGIPSVAYHLDLYMGLRRWNEYHDHEYFKVKHFFTVDKLMADWLNENTNTIGHYLPAGVFESECYMALPEPRFDFDVVFVGSRRYHPEWQYRPKLIQFLEQTYGKRFAHFGNDGKHVVRGDELNRVYASAKVVVGDTLCIDFTYPHYWSDRIYETTGRGGMIVHPFIQGIDTQFEDGKEVVFYQYGDMKDLKTKIDQLLKDADYREKIRSAGHERTKRDHTYTNRLQTIIETVKGQA